MDRNIFKKLNILIFVLIAAVILTLIAGLVIYSRQAKLLNSSFNKNQELQKEVNILREQLSNFEQNREFYALYPGPKYENDKHKFSMEIPKDWFIIERFITNGPWTAWTNNNSNSDDIDVVNFVSEDYKAGLLNSENSDSNRPLLFSLTIFPKDDLEEKAPYFQNINPDLEQAFSKGLVDKIEYNKGNGIKIELFVISQKNDSWRYSLDKTLPDADAFLEDEKYIYYFDTEDYLPMDERGRRDIVEIIKKSLESFKFDK